MTGAVSGVSADRLPAADLCVAWEHIADAVRGLHGLPVERCPFRRGPDVMVTVAHEVVGRGGESGVSPVEQQHTPPEELLGRRGLADHYADLALLLANARETWQDEQQARALASRPGHVRAGFRLFIRPGRTFDGSEGSILSGSLRVGLRCDACFRIMQTLLRRRATEPSHP